METFSHLTINQVGDHLTERYWLRNRCIDLNVRQFVRKGYEITSFTVRYIPDGLTGNETELTLEEVRVLEGIRDP